MLQFGGQSKCLKQGKDIKESKSLSKGIWFFVHTFSEMASVERKLGDDKWEATSNLILRFIVVSFIWKNYRRSFVSHYASLLSLIETSCKKSTSQILRSDVVIHLANKKVQSKLKRTESSKFLSCYSLSRLRYRVTAFEEWAPINSFSLLRLFCSFF